MPELEWDFTAWCRDMGSQPAIVDWQSTITYQQLEAQSRDIAGKLQQRGIEFDSIVATIGENTVEHVILMFAVWRAGGICFPMSTRFPADQQRSVVEKLAAVCAIIIEPGHKDPVADSQIEWAELLRADENPDAASNICDTFSASRRWSIILTSGSSGVPQAAVHTFANHFYSAMGSRENLPIDQGDRWLLSLPLFHIGGMAIVMRCLLSGATIVCPQDRLTPEPGFLEKQGVSHLSLVPTQLQWLIEQGLGESFGRGIKAFLLGGAALPDSLLNMALQRKLPLYRSYGSTEMCSQITTTAKGAGKEDGSGRLLKYRELVINEQGEILVRGKTLFAGYLDNGQLQRPTVADGWFPTGDLGRMSPKGHLHVTGRADNMFISGGENIQPEEIEQALIAISGVRNALVVAVEDADFGKRPFAFVDVAADFGIDRENLRDQLLSRLPKFKIPVDFVGYPSQMPASGIKIDRKSARILAERILAEKKGENRD